MNHFQIGEIEEILINAFPAVEREIYDGWILNFSEGYTYRANCINPFYPSSYDLKEKLRHCEQQYRNLSLPAVYKMSPAVSAELDALLAAEGYEIVKYVDVLERSLNDWKTPAEDDRSDDFEMVTSSRFDDEWLDGVNRLIEIPDMLMEAAQKKIFGRIRLPLVCVKVRKDDQVIGTGLGVLERQYIGLYAIHVDKRYRRCGVATKICSRIIDRGIEMGAARSHLQVRRGNTGAFQMYERLGLKKIYSQWFRMKSWPESREIFD